MIESQASTRVRVLYSAEQIRDKVREMGLAVAKDYAGLNPVLVGVLKGACMFQADLARAAAIELELDFVSVSSYGQGTRSSGAVKLLSDLRGDIAGRHVLICEAVVDSGRSLSMLLRELGGRGAASLEVAALLDKRPRREIEVPVRYAGWSVGPDFVVGYGLDAGDRLRNLPYVGVLEEA